MHFCFQIITKQWDEVVRSISALSKASLAKATPHEFLESVHVYVLSNILRRPIIIVTDLLLTSSGSHLGEDSHIAGIYLPLEWPPIKCCKTPIILGFSQGHFCPLLSETTFSPKSKEPLFPLVTKDFSFLPVRFLSQQEEHKACELVQSYFIVKEANISFGMDGEVPVPCAVLSYKDLPLEMNTVMEHFKMCEQNYHQQIAQGQHRGQNEASLFHQLHIDSQTKVAPMRSFSQSYQMSLKNQAIKDKVKAERILSEKNVEEERWSNVGRCIIRGCNRQGNALRNNFCDSCWGKFSMSGVGAGSISLHQRQLEMFTNQSGGAGPDFNQLKTKNTVHIEPSAPPASRLTSLETPVSMLEERCHNKCGFRCSQETYPYCHECFNLFEANHPVHQGSSFISNREGPFSLGIASSNLNDINNPNGNLMLFSPSPLPALKCPFADSSFRVEHTLAKEGNNDDHVQIKPSERSSPEIKKLRMKSRVKSEDGQELIMQLIPEGVLEVTNPSGMQGLYKASKLSRLAMSDKKQPSEEEDIIYMSGESATCVSPYCEEKTDLPYKLCDKCQAVLKAQKQKKAEGNITNKSSVDLQREKLSLIQIGHMDNHNFQAPKKQEAKEQREAKHRQRGKPCVTSGCLNYGDPVNSDLCSSCYNKLAIKEYEKLNQDAKFRAKGLSRRPNASATDRKVGNEPATRWTEQSLLSFAPSSSSHNAAEKPAKAHTVNLPVSAFCTNITSLSPSSGGSMHGSLENFPTFDINTFNQCFAHEYDKFRNQTSAGLKRCKVTACTNYGNPSKGGYCNSCHAKKEEKRYEERVALFGENVPDGRSSQQNSI